MSSERLRPARYERPDRRWSKPGLPWARWAVLCTIGALALVGYRVQERVRAADVRERIGALYDDDVRPWAPRVDARETTLERLLDTAASAGRPLPAQTEPGFDVDAFRREGLLYLHLTRREARDADALRVALAETRPDAVARCLGVEALSPRAVLADRARLGSTWLDEARATEGTLRLRVIEAELRRFIEARMPDVRRFVGARYFLLLLADDAAPASSVDAYVWDLSPDDAPVTGQTRAAPRQIARARVTPRGALVPVRIAIGAAGATDPMPSDEAAVAAADCSLAAQLERL